MGTGIVYHANALQFVDGIDANALRSLVGARAGLVRHLSTRPSDSSSLPLWMTPEDEEPASQALFDPVSQDGLAVPAKTRGVALPGVWLVHWGRGSSE
ncbi:MAG: hypothetical protein HY904_18810 [Deltaproteobacteria bacterium]|nr:hypothetical protein [Deltaproteobacteria bacterium]